MAELVVGGGIQADRREKEADDDENELIKWIGAGGTEIGGC